MNKNRNINNIIILILSIALGFTIALQYHTAKGTLGEVLPSQKIQEINLELKKVNTEKKLLLDDLNELESKLKEYEQNASEENVYIKKLSEELEKYTLIGGYSDVKGSGVIISIDNPPLDIQYNGYTNNLIYNYEYLLLVISNLNAAGAEAISINDQRYTTYTEIIPVGSHININGVSFIPPFEIKAIGNKQTLESVLNFKGGVVWEMKSLNYQVDIEVKDEIIINRNMKPKEFKYAESFDSTE